MSTTSLPPFSNDRFTYKLAQAYWNHYPGINALRAAAFTDGTATEKVDAGVQGFAHGLGFKLFNTYFDRFLVGFYNRHPKVAEAAHNHPILVGATIALVGSIGGGLLGALLAGGWNRLKKPALNLMEKGFGHSTVQKVANTLKLPQISKMLSSPTSKLVFGVGSLLFSVMLVGRVLIDSVKFSRHYKDARAQDPNASPYDLRDAVLNNPMETPSGLPNFNPFMRETQTATPFAAVA